MEYKKDFKQLFNDLNSFKHSVAESIWLIYAETFKDTSFTSSDIKGYGTFSPIISYAEDLKIINKQISGEMGISASNLNFIMNRDSNSVQFFNKFCDKSTLNKVQLVELVQSGGSFSQKQLITYNLCKIESYKNNMSTAEISINYTTRADKYTSYSNGLKSGNFVSNFS